MNNNRPTERTVLAWLIIALSLQSPVLVSAVTSAESSSSLSWKTLAAGIEYTSSRIVERPVIGDGLLHIVRVDSSRAGLRLLAASALDKRSRTARNWCSEFKMIAVINAGMYDIDHLTHIGYMRSNNRVNNGRWIKDYKSILAFGPLRDGLVKAQIIDRAGNEPDVLQQYDTVIQNLRLIQGSGVNVWKEQQKRWSEAALAMDDQGRLLFLFSKSPLSMKEFNNRILALPLGIIRAMHLEGGPEASMSICTGDMQLHLFGSYETGFLEDDSNFSQWPLPNVIGVMVEAR